MTTRPNLFSFATSELSQDAFLCWLAALSTSDDRELSHAGRRFLAWLWESAGNSSVDPEHVKLVGLPERQVERIDVLLRAEVLGKPVTFLIEDKTHTSHHSGQLGRYRTAAEKRLPQVVPIYFKTGYHFGEDASARDAGYTVIGLDSWVEFLHRVELKNDILDDYRAHLSSLLRERTATLDALWTSGGFGHLRTDYAQYAFLSRLQQHCPNLDANSPSAISRGTNMGGTPWSHLGFAWLANTLSDGIGESFFHRVDKRRHGDGDRYYLSTRQYAEVKGSPEARKAKVSRLWQHRRAFDEAKKVPGTSLVFSKPSGDSRGANESEIGVLFFDDSTNTTRAVLEQFPRIHEAFITRLRAHIGEGFPE
ncbi:MAG: hypothetical protein KJ015_09840 [Myxococcales bacterium]|nr:hypothetical protein [Myxococcales bacterium]